MGKYTCQSPVAASARYHRKMPERGQNEKYCRAQVREPQADEPPVRFNTETLARWFMAIDKDNSGTVSPKELKLALRNSHELRHLFCHLQGLAFAESGSKTMSPSSRGVTKTSTVMSRTMSPIPNLADGRLSSGYLLESGELPEEGDVKEAMQKLKDRKAELKRLNNILRDLDEDASGCMSFEEFVEFFKRAGLLLEYSTGQNYSDNHPNLDYLMRRATMAHGICAHLHNLTFLQDPDDDCHDAEPSSRWASEVGDMKQLSPGSTGNFSPQSEGKLSPGKLTPAARKAEVWMQQGGAFVNKERAAAAVTRMNSRVLTLEATEARLPN